jgi:type III pantothenate kinase
LNLLVDIGNTRLKWGVATDSQITAGRSFVNDRLKRHELIDAWKDITPPKRLAVSCVSAKQLFELVQSVALELWSSVEIVPVKSQAQAFGVINAYQQPEKLGVDRWLSLVAVRHQYRGAACVVDCGTAITVDVIDADGHHLGGLISPGLSLMKKSLVEGTEALQFSETKYPHGRIGSLPIATLPPFLVVGLADYTEAAIYSGTLSAAIGLIEHVLSKQPKNTQLILTGGDAELIAEQLAFTPIIDPDLVLRGLLVILEGRA